MARSFGRGAVSGHTSRLALGSAACWAIFTLLARPAVREGRALPVLTIVLGVGAACLLATLLATGPGRLLIGGRALWLSMLAGGVCVGLGLLCWLGAVAIAPPATVAPLWYLTVVFGMVWVWRIGGVTPGWRALPGAALVIVGACVAFAGRGGDAEAEDLTL
jgi:drug/metabolite transporter (DMT)-like permease